MSLLLLPQIEKSIEDLSQEEQLQLVERIVHRLRQKWTSSNGHKQSEFEKLITLMANDLQIQSELRAINDEFAVTENDGLENL